MVGVPGTAYRMGDDREPDSSPAHMVEVAPFCIGRAEVTTGEYRRCFSAGSCPAPGPRTNSGRSNFYAGLDSHPINYVTWSDAVAYCRFVSARLPTEAEWELAARGTEARLYPWGDDEPSSELVQWAGACNGCRPETASAGSMARGASQFGALDLAGNVAEWVADFFGPYTADAQRSPTGPSAGTVRTIRGGGWPVTQAIFFRGTNRQRGEPSSRRPDVGFRCVR